MKKKDLSSAIEVTLKAAALALFTFLLTEVYLTNTKIIEMGEKMKLLVTDEYQIISSPSNELAREKLNTRIVVIEKDVDRLDSYHQ